MTIQNEIILSFFLIPFFVFSERRIGMKKTKRIELQYKNQSFFILFSYIDIHRDRIRVIIRNI